VERGLSSFPTPETLPLEPRRDDALRASLRPPTDSRLVGMAGRIHPAKGFDVIVPALARCSESGSTWWCSGDHEGYPQRVLDLATASGVRGRVHVLGFPEPGALNQTYA
jgi:glycosyltransferase involved in cell wall biosynthesis